MKYPTLLLLGPPGSGKGTHGRMLGKNPACLHCSSGEIFRRLDPQTGLSQIVRSYTNRGDLVPDEVAVRIWRDHMRQMVEEGVYDPQHHLLLLDGIPRNEQQIGLLAHDIDVWKVLFLYAPNEEELVRRIRDRALKEDRHDDANESIIRHRLKVYNDLTRPMLTHFSEDRIARIDAMQPIETVFRQVQDAVEPLIHRLNGAPSRP